MAECMIFGSGMGALYLDQVTATAGDVLSGKVIVDASGNPITGTLALSGDAATENVLSGKTFYSNDAKSKKNGTMSNNGTMNRTLNCGQSVVIPAGYHNGKGIVTANALAGQTSATASAADILNGKTAWVNGSKITGKLVRHVVAFGDNSYHIDGNGGTGAFDVSQTIPSGALNPVCYYSGVSGSRNAVGTYYCQIYKNGTLVDSRDSGGGYTFRGTMINRQLSVSAGDVIRLYAYAVSGTYTFADIHAVIVYYTAS